LPFFLFGGAAQYFSGVGGVVLMYHPHCGEKLPLAGPVAPAPFADDVLDSLDAVVVVDEFEG